MTNPRCTEPGDPAMDATELRRQLEQVHADCFGWALACCRRDRDAAEEGLQTVYLSVLDGHARYDGRSSFRTWLFGVIRRTVASRRRTAWLRQMLLTREAARLSPAAAAAPDAEVERSSGNRRIQRALARLAPRQSEVLQLVFYHDMTVEEAAMVMGVSVGSARTHYARGKARLAAWLAESRER